jgi:hypothetical protein
MTQQRRYPGISSFQGWQNLLTVISIYISLTVMVFFRRKLGYRRLSVGALLGMSFVLYLIDSFSRVHVSLIGGMQTSGPGLLTWYAFTFLCWGFWQRHLQWKALRSGEYWHTYSGGISYFEFLPLRLDRIYRNVDPALCAIAGLCLRNLGFASLGSWVLLAAFAWRIVEEQAYQASLQRDLDAGDALLEAHMQAQYIEQLDAPQQPRSLRETGGIPTGADETLAEVLARRRKEAQAEKPSARGAA